MIDKTIRLAVDTSPNSTPRSHVSYTRHPGPKSLFLGRPQSHPGVAGQVENDRQGVFDWITCAGTSPVPIIQPHPMLIFLILVHLLSRNGSAAPVSHPLESQPSDDSCDDINNCRKLFDIIWGCLATIFACTWVSVHPNVPPPNQSRLALLWRKLKMMLVGIVVPEVMIGFATRQFLGARMLSKEFGFSRTHGFFFAMGGFVSSTGYPLATKEQLEDPALGPKFLKAIQDISAEDIMDKSKGDALSKSVALLQGLWFITQCLARVHQHLAVTEFELATMAFAVVNMFIWLLWWNKSLDVERQIVVRLAKMPDAQPINLVRVPLLGRVGYAFAGHTAPGDKYNPLSSTSVPSFWTFPLGYYPRLGTMGITALVGSVFGAIHCAAWNAHFSTATEMWMWRTCSSVIAAIPPIFLLLSLIGTTINETPVGETILGRAILINLSFIILGAIPIYIFSRLTLIVLPFAALRSLPPSAFVDVNWSTYIPHV